MPESISEVPLLGRRLPFGREDKLGGSKLSRLVHERKKNRLSMKREEKSKTREKTTQVLPKLRNSYFISLRKSLKNDDSESSQQFVSDQLATSDHQQLVEWTYKNATWRAALGRRDSETSATLFCVAWQTVNFLSSCVRFGVPLPFFLPLPLPSLVVKLGDGGVWRYLGPENPGRI